MTAVILAGGQSRRMGRDKLILTAGGETLLERAVRRYRAVFPRVLVSVAAPEKFPELESVMAGVEDANVIKADEKLKTQLEGK